MPRVIRVEQNGRDLLLIHSPDPHVSCAHRLPFSLSQCQSPSYLLPRGSDAQQHGNPNQQRER